MKETKTKKTKKENKKKINFLKFLIGIGFIVLLVMMFQGIFPVKIIGFSMGKPYFKIPFTDNTILIVSRKEWNAMNKDEIDLESVKKSNIDMEERKKNDTDKYACKYAENRKNPDVWCKYKKAFPEGECIEIADKLCDRIGGGKPVLPINNRLSTGDEWSKITSKNYDWSAAKRYCEKLSEGGHNDWKLPTIDQLRTLIKDRETSSKGACKVTEKCSSFKECFSTEACAESCRNGYCEEYPGSYSVFSDTSSLWSSTLISDKKNCDKKEGNCPKAWAVNFSIGHIEGYDNKTSTKDKYPVRCVRRWR